MANKSHIFSDFDYRKIQSADTRAELRRCLFTDADLEPSRVDKTFYQPLDVSVRNFIASGQSVNAVRTRLSNLPTSSGNPVVDGVKANMFDRDIYGATEPPEVTQAIYAHNDEVEQKQKELEKEKKKQELDKRLIDSLAQKRD